MCLCQQEKNKNNTENKAKYEDLLATRENPRIEVRQMEGKKPTNEKRKKKLDKKEEIQSAKFFISESLDQTRRFEPSTSHSHLLCSRTQTLTRSVFTPPQLPSPLLSFSFSLPKQQKASLNELKKFKNS